MIQSRFRQSSYGVYGYVEYNSQRFGVEFTHEDDDDGQESSQEAIFETPGLRR
jgi:hypothetical protein